MTLAATDSELLRQFCDKASASAFEELVNRHLNHVFSAALRRVNGDHALAKDVTQTVFVDFARKAMSIPAEMPPGGWLHRHTGFVASKMIDKERRRRNREREAATMNSNELTTSSDPEWSATAPLLDAAMDTLPESDRDAIVLRFFEQKDFRTVGAALGMSDDSAQKKVSRAVDKLRRTLGRRGVTSSGGALAALMLANSVQAAPAPLAANIASQSLAGAATAGVTGVGTLGAALAGLSTAARIQVGAIVIAIAAAAGIAGSKIASPEPPPVEPEAGVVAKRAAIPEEPPVAPPAAPPAGSAREPDLKDLIETAAAEWRGGRETVAGNARALDLITKVKIDQMTEALEIARGLGDEQARLRVMKNLIALWAEAQPRQAMQWALMEEGAQHRADLQKGLMTAWAGNDPEAVLGLSMKTGSSRFPGVPVNESVVATAFRTMAMRDSKRAFARLEMLALPRRSAAIRGILDTVDTDEEIVEVDALIRQIRTEETRIQARRALVEKWARRDPLAAAGYVERAQPAWERTRLMDSLGYTWLQSDPEVAARWWVKHVPGPDTLVKVINVWAQQDANAAGKWLGEFPVGATSDAARRTFARQVADRDPEAALRWADTVTDEKMRESAIEHIFQSWRDRNPDAAKAFLSNAGWPEERAKRLNE